MGVDFYVYKEEDWKFNQPLDSLPFAEWAKLRRKESFYVRESYHGLTHAVRIFSPESYERGSSDDSVVLDWRVLLPRMPEVAKACIERELGYLSKTDDSGFRRLPELNEEAIMKPSDDELTYGISQLQIFMDIVKFCIAEEREGRKVVALNSY